MNISRHPNIFNDSEITHLACRLSKAFAKHPTYSRYRRIERFADALQTDERLDRIDWGVLHGLTIGIMSMAFNSLSEI